MDSPRRRRLDLRGLRCPLNWARARVFLEQLEAESEVELWVDDPRGARDIPGAAEACGYQVLAVEEVERAWRIVVVV